MDATIRGLRLPEGFAGDSEDNGLPLPPPASGGHQRTGTDRRMVFRHGRARAALRACRALP